MSVLSKMLDVRGEMRRSTQNGAGTELRDRTVHDDAIAQVLGTITVVWGNIRTRHQIDSSPHLTLSLNYGVQ